MPLELCVYCPIIGTAGQRGPAFLGETYRIFIHSAIKCRNKLQKALICSPLFILGRVRSRDYYFRQERYTYICKKRDRLAIIKSNGSFLGRSLHYKFDIWTFEG